MGTRNLTAVFHDGKYCVAQYGQWDGYPSGQGLTALEFLRDKMDKQLFIDKLKETFNPTDEQMKQWWIDAGHDGESDWVSFEVSDRFKSKHPTLNRDMAAKVLEHIQSSTSKVPINLSIDFAADSLFCEWAYVLDLDKNTFEVYEGFNKSPLLDDERFFGATCEDGSVGYYPVKLRHSFNLDNLPSNDSFIDVFRSQEYQESDD